MRGEGGMLSGVSTVVAYCSPRGWVVALGQGRHGGGCPGFGAPPVGGECYRSFRGTPEQAAVESGSPVFKTWREVGVIEDNAIATAINKREL